ncbi:hypothetical protein Scep_014087 [Stephania cephalantha]|uniref:BHLH domain-containing protein n=1 Tax=Stephania cephalantha TaxID=152367 RepID=A0AAP0J0K1_9MAGN
MATDIRCDWVDDAAAPGSSDDGRAGRSSSSGVDARERHKLAERERRKSMRELFLSLHSLLPHSATVRKEQSAILDEIIKYIPIAAARLRSLQKQREAPPEALLSPRSASIAAATAKSSPSLKVSSRSDSNSGECSIRVMPEPSSSVSIRVRGDRVNVSLTDTKGANHTMLLSSLLDELESHNLELIRSTNCRDGSKLLHHSESKICDGLEKSPALLKERLQELACKLHDLKKSTSLKRAFDQID